MSAAQPLTARVGPTALDSALQPSTERTRALAVEADLLAAEIAETADPVRVGAAAPGERARCVAALKRARDSLSNDVADLELAVMRLQAAVIRAAPALSGPLQTSTERGLCGQLPSDIPRATDDGSVGPA